MHVYMLYFRDSEYKTLLVRSQYLHRASTYKWSDENTVENTMYSRTKISELILQDKRHLS